MLPILVFVLVTGLVLGAYALLTRLHGLRAERQVGQRLHEITLSQGEDGDDTSILKRDDDGPLPVLDRALTGTRAGSWLIRLIEQSGVQTTPSAIVASSLAAAAILAFVAVVARQPAFSPL